MRLPTEAEWEYAARGGSQSARYGQIDAIAWYDGNSGNRTHAVKGKAPNGYGLYDMLGNVSEWTSGWLGQIRSLRGGSWNDSPSFVRLSGLYGDVPTNRFDSYGFRCVGD
jgi:formylglycine-generating enzyme required for sulfatase activity